MSGRIIVSEEANIRGLASAILLSTVEDARRFKGRNAIDRAGLNFFGVSYAYVMNSVERFVIGEDAEWCLELCDVLDIDYPAFAKKCGFITDYGVKHEPKRRNTGSEEQTHNPIYSWDQQEVDCMSLADASAQE